MAYIASKGYFKRYKMKNLIKYICSIILLIILLMTAVVKLAIYDVKYIDIVFILMLPIFADSLIYQIIE